ncbi:MAG: hypothetical protein H0X38_06075 [Planctomycetes bacterium]|nr:hypothetical protein [Planctomycetota bacterium]
MTTSALRTTLLLLGVAAMTGTGLAGAEAAKHKPAPSPVQIGDPLAGAPLDVFLEGQDTFNEVETLAANGLGPTFNGTSCAQCHGVPAIGGSSSITVIRAQLYDAHTGTSTELPGGSLFNRFAIDPRVQEFVPPEANVVSLRRSPPLFGDGLIEAIPDATIQAIAFDQEYSAANGNAKGTGPHGQDAGIHGRVNIVQDLATKQMHVGRFGWKAQLSTLLDFSGDAYLNEMGITNQLFPHGRVPNGDLAKYLLGLSLEPFADPKDVSGDIFRFADFMRLLAPPPRGPQTKDVLKGEKVFATVGCAICHVPTMMTGPNPLPYLSNQPVNLYSDLLLHDVDTGNSVAQSGAGAFEVKTPPLWGLRYRVGFLHDQSMSTLRQAIQAHGGEAASVIAAFDDLKDKDVQDLMAFLGSL